MHFNTVNRLLEKALEVSRKIGDLQEAVAMVAGGNENAGVIYADLENLQRELEKIRQKIRESRTV